MDEKAFVIIALEIIAGSAVIWWLWATVIHIRLQNRVTGQFEAALTALAVRYGVTALSVAMLVYSGVKDDHSLFLIGCGVATFAAVVFEYRFMRSIWRAGKADANRKTALEALTGQGNDN